MEQPTTKRIRRSLIELQNDYENGNKAPLETLMRAWKGIKELSPEDPRSFFNLGGYHGEPFRGAGWGFGNNAFWGGYCNHGNVLFPTWHRIYVLKVEEALQSIEGCEDVMLPYWDETDEASLKNGIPWALTRKDFELDGITIPNPLRSFVFPITITDNISTDNGLYTKPKGYETVRYPLSGLVGNAQAKEKTEKHNSQYPDYDQNVKILNQNIVAWLNNTVVLPDHQKNPIGILTAFERSLRAPNYTVFSNTTSAQQWNDLHDPSNGLTELVVPLEQPHNDIHLAVGGFDVPGQGDLSPITDANGDMGENDTAALDPIFYFHHCNVDRVFWLWQKQNGHTDTLEIIQNYPGTNSSDNQGSTPGIPPNTWLTLETPLNPFIKKEGKKERVYTSLDCINIEKQLGFTYSEGSLEQRPEKLSIKEGFSKKIVRISRINRAPIKGSFVVSAYANIGGERYHLGSKGVLSRWNVTHCANCQTHLEVKAFFGLGPFSEERLTNATFEVEINGHEQSTPALLEVKEKNLYHIEVR